MVSRDEIASLEKQSTAMLDDAIALVADAGASAPDARRRAQRVLHQMRAHLTRPSVFVLAGEFNSGKSTLANRLADIEALPTDLFANTSVPTRLHWAGQIEVACIGSSGLRLPLAPSALCLEEPLARLDVGAPIAFLSALDLIDTPGLADPEMERDGSDLLAHRPDALIWCTPATQAWKETERVVWSRLPARLRQHTILALTFCDLLEEAREVERVRARLEREAGPFHAIVAVSGPAKARACLEPLRRLARDLADALKLDRLARTARLSQRLLARL